jgi:UDP-N-acetylglucosamine transferase subunit ALG13
MIFVTVGTSTFAFERLLRRVDELDLADELVVQYGASTFVPRAAETCRFMEYSAVAEHMRKARAVIAHGGAGSILTALYVGVRPIVVPRRKEYGEVIDDHQLELSARLERAGLVTLALNPADLTAALFADGGRSDAITSHSALIGDISAYVDAILDPPAR